MRRINPAGDCGVISPVGSAGGGVLSLPGILSEVDWPLPLWLASVDIGIDGARRPDWSAELPVTDNSTRGRKEAQKMVP